MFIILIDNFLRIYFYHIMNVSISNFFSYFYTLKDNAIDINTITNYRINPKNLVFPDNKKQKKIEIICPNKQPNRIVISRF
jgi:hypothetical protein